MPKKIDYLSLGLYCAFIFWLSSRESIPAPMWFPHQDKLYHAAAYAIMGYLSWRCFRHTFKTPWLLMLVSVLFCSLYGVSDEWHQSFVKGRDSSGDDWVADTIGALLGVLWVSRSRNITPQSADGCITRQQCVYDCPNCTEHPPKSL